MGSLSELLCSGAEGDGSDPDSDNDELDRALLDVIATRDAREQQAVSNAVAEPIHRSEPYTWRLSRGYNPTTIARQLQWFHQRCLSSDK